MTKTRVFLHCAAAVIVAFGICGQQELKAQDAAGPVANVVRAGQVDVIPEDGFDAGAGLYQGIVAVGDNPPTVGKTPTWPCAGGTGDPECSSLAAGGFVIPFPLQVIPAKANGEIVWTFTTTTATGTADFKVTIIQGTTTIFSDSFTSPVTANSTWYAYVTGAKLSGATAGAATVTVTTTVGTAKITGKTVLHIQ